MDAKSSDTNQVGFNYTLRIVQLDSTVEGAMFRAKQRDDTLFRVGDVQSIKNRDMLPES